MERRTHLDSSTQRIGRKLARTRGYNVNSLEPAVLEDLGTTIKRRRIFVGMAAVGLVAAGAVAISNNYDNKYDACPTEQTTPNIAEAQPTPSTLSPFDAAEAGCNNI